MKKTTLSALAILAAMVAHAQLQPTKLSVFSNGTFFEQKEGKLKFNNSIGKVDLPGTILQGTFWLAGSNDIKIKQIDIAVDTVKKVKSAQYLDDFLAANEGKNVTLRFTPALTTLANPTLRSLTGTLVSFNKQSGLIKLKNTEGKIILINADNLNDIDLDANANETFKDDTLIRRASIYLDKPATEAPFNQVTMQTGLQWQPSYYIKLENDKDARLIMKATVENGTEVDYDKIDLDLVVGAPQLFFGTAADPICDFFAPPPPTASYTWDYDGSEDLNYRGAGRFRRSFTRNDDITMQGIISVTDMNGTSTVPQIKTRGKLLETISGGMPAMYDGDVTGGVIDISGAYNVAIDITGDKDYSSAGKKSADLYYYNAGKVSLPRNAKTLLPISQSTISYKHVYEANIGDITNYAYNRAVLVDEAKPSDVFHSLKITNKTAAPLTEAPVFIVNENEDPIAQDKLNYTPVNEEATIKLSKAIDVSVKSKEEEIGKDEKARKFNKRSYDKVTLKGMVDVVNSLDKAITLTLKKALRGDVTKTDGGTITKPGRFLDINPVSLIKWEVDLKPGEKKTITYEYEVYIAP
ncbi:MAG: DUF4139 domain-containing protein [Sphingobacteriales bacterium JAD_PAG50586_3]|nr:MAG: DUF4139 domain-containing protein [Sphingobacteriales bacterium JAD_PAG50586_3]